MPIVRDWLSNVNGVATCIFACLSEQGWYLHDFSYLKHHGWYLAKIASYTCMIFTYMYIAKFTSAMGVKTKTDQEFVHSNRSPETAFRFQTGIKFGQVLWIL